MKNLENYGVLELNTKKIEVIDGLTLLPFPPTAFAISVYHIIF